MCCCCCCCCPVCCYEYCRLFGFAFCTRFNRVDTKESVVFTAHVPGIMAHDIKVQVESEKFLRIIGERNNEEYSSDGSCTKMSTLNGRFVKLYKLPKNIEAAGVRAEVDDEGFITVTVPKSKGGDIIVS